MENRDSPVFCGRGRKFEKEEWQHRWSSLSRPEGSGLDGLDKLDLRSSFDKLDLRSSFDKLEQQLDLPNKNKVAIIRKISGEAIFFEIEVFEIFWLF